MYVACGLKAFPPLPTRLRPWVSFSALRPAFMDIRKSGLGWMNLPSRCFAVQMDKRAVQSKKKSELLINCFGTVVIPPPVPTTRRRRVDVTEIIIFFSDRFGACHFCHSCHSCHSDSRTPKKEPVRRLEVFFLALSSKQHRKSLKITRFGPKRPE